jgi:hypothetical protein
MSAAENTSKNAMQKLFRAARRLTGAAAGIAATGLALHYWIAPRFFYKQPPRADIYFALHGEPALSPTAQRMQLFLAPDSIYPVTPANITGCVNAFNQSYSTENPPKVVTTTFHGLTCTRTDYGKDADTLENNINWAFWDNSRSNSVEISAWKYESNGRAAEVILSDKAIEMGANGNTTWSQRHEGPGSTFFDSITHDHGLPSDEEALATFAYNLRRRLFAPGAGN